MNTEGLFPVEFPGDGAWVMRGAEQYGIEKGGKG